jgi:hypothetical protein
MIRLSIKSLQPVAYESHKFPLWPVVNSKTTQEKLNFPMWPLHEGCNSEAGLHISSHKTSNTLD